MRLTIRGWAVVAVVAASFAMAWEFGPRALNAIVTPLIVVLVAGVVTTLRADRPEIRRRSVGEGFIGETREVTVTIDSGTTVSATVRDTVGDGLSAVDGDPVAETTLDGATTFSYDVRLEKRGNKQVGPLSIVVTDVLGLVKRRFEYEETAAVLVYPRIHDLRGGSTRDLQALAAIADQRDREEFDHLREYQRGDSLRDVHWKSAAKRPDDDLVVTEYVTDDEVGSATVAGECLQGEGSPDKLAETVASVATYLLEEGVDVGVTVPDDARPPGSGQEHHYDLLGLLALVDAGELEDQQRRAADVLVRTDADGTRVTVGGQTIPFDHLVNARGRTERADRDGQSRGRGRAGTAADAETGTDTTAGDETEVGA
ncbi:DUF58 domain-containing protein [Natronorubrum sp. JWXQ-INN-674]|uniref:DUF58 domain-containing protein n=1 Tax=Natronorubrum halalkaliphilum TaxID=2691917 RepID=A0A6B0VKV3_9EURY|nr:DUF58 domain-containing protein [Natronorubrum halalkaliphilum]MXV61412.1 DUF58 domain-containing protein [Natronorubrum halalkaliphilum]